MPVLVNTNFQKIRCVKSVIVIVIVVVVVVVKAKEESSTYGRLFYRKARRVVWCGKVGRSLEDMIHTQKLSTRKVN